MDRCKEQMRNQMSDQSFMFVLISFHNDAIGNEIQQAYLSVGTLCILLESRPSALFCDE